jgi:hypothetical protein
MKPSSQSIPPRLSRSRSNAARSLANVPSRLHCWKRRWQVAVDGYRSGRSAQGAPVRSIQRIPLSTSRGSRQGRPLRSLRSRGLGRKGATFSHCLSVRSMNSVDHDLTPLSIFRLPLPISDLVSTGYVECL